MPTIIERLGAALAAPTAAMATADSPEGGGRAPVDLAVLALASFAATHAVELTRAGWMVVDADGWGAVNLMLAQLSAWLRAPLVAVIAGGVLVVALAGARRSPGADFDLACVAAVPVAAQAVVVELVARGGWISRGALEQAGLVAGSLWAAVLIAIAVRQARQRPPPAPAGEAPA